MYPVDPQNVELFPLERFSGGGRRIHALISNHLIGRSVLYRTRCRNSTHHSPLRRKRSSQAGNCPPAHCINRDPRAWKVVGNTWGKRKEAKSTVQPIKIEAGSGNRGPCAPIVPCTTTVASATNPSSNHKLKRRAQVRRSLSLSSPIPFVQNRSSLKGPHEDRHENKSPVAFRWLFHSGEKHKIHSWKRNSSEGSYCGRRATLFIALNV